jgi:hypothetical protein
MDKPLEKQQPLGPHQGISQSQSNTLRNAGGGQRTCALHPEQHKIPGPQIESTSTCARMLGKGGSGDLHRGR